MNSRVLLSAAALLCLAAGSPTTYGQTATNTKIAIINIQDAITRTLEGQKLAKDLQGKYGPTRDKLGRLQNEIQSLRDQLSRGANTMSDEARNKLGTRVAEQGARPEAGFRGCAIGIQPGATIGFERH